MSKAIRRTLFLAGIALLGATTFASARFYFGSEQNASSTLSNNLKVDDIEENYDFGKNASDKEGKTYTFYFFPSASYLHLYSEYLSGNVTTKPEEQFGYKEASLSTSGSVSYALSSETGQYKSETTYDGGYRHYMGKYFSTVKFEADGGTAYGDGTAYGETQNYLSSNSLPMRTWGIPNDEFTIFPDDANREEKYNGRNQYSTDRFGSWSDCYYYGETVSDSSDDKAPTGLIKGDVADDTSDSALANKMDDTNTGRYLPIKFTVTNELTSSMMEKVVPDVFTSMGTDLGGSVRLHNYSLTEWTYVKNPDSSSRVYPYSPSVNDTSTGENKIGEAFQPKQRDTYFDLLSDLDQYADSEGVIRLFPLFSNGKKSSATSYYDGGGSTEKLKVTNSDGTLSYLYPFFRSDVYNNGEGVFTYEEDGQTKTEDILTSSYINLFSFNNIRVTSNTSALNFSSNNIWGKPANWITVDGALLYNDLYVLDNDYIQNQLIGKYGEGLYTFHVFVANYSYQNGPSDNSEVPERKATFTSFYNYVVEQAVAGKFSSLTSKHLVQVRSEDGATINKDDDFMCSPMVIAFEKIEEPRLMFSSSEPTSLSSFASANYSNGRSFYRNVSSLYEATKEDGASTYKTTGSDLKSTSPYTYFIKNVDLTDPSNPYFVISFNSSATSIYPFTTSSETMDYDHLIATSQASETNVSESNVYQNAYEDFAYVSDGVFKLKDDSCLDVYDILIRFNSQSKYDIYLRRHDKLFCYVFDQNLADPAEGQFVNHSFDTVNYKVGDATLLFDGKFTEGHELDSSDYSASVNGGSSLDECLRLKIGGSETYSGDSLLSYCLLDRVSGRKVAEYVQNEDSTYSLKCNLMVEKNYILYLSSNA